MAQWRVYTRADCCLCEQMLEELAHLLGPAAADVQVVDVDSEASLALKYGSRIPVLTVDGDFVCAYRLDRERVQLLLPN